MSSTSGPIPKFVSTRGTFRYELRNLRTTSNSMILVPLLNPKFAIALPHGVRELRVRGTSVSGRDLREALAAVTAAQAPKSAATAAG
jgi:hypothetical protein